MNSFEEFKNKLSESSSWRPKEFRVELKKQNLDLIGPKIPYVEQEKKKEDLLTQLADLGFEQEKEYEIQDESAIVHYTFEFTEKETGISSIILVPISVSLSFTVRIYEGENLDRYEDVYKNIEITSFSETSKVNWKLVEINLPLVITNLEVYLESPQSEIGTESWLREENITINFSVGEDN